MGDKNAPPIDLVQADVAVSVLAGVRHPRIAVTRDIANYPTNFAPPVVRFEGIVTAQFEKLAKLHMIQFHVTVVRAHPVIITRPVVPDVAQLDFGFQAMLKPVFGLDIGGLDRITQKRLNFGF